MVRYLIAFILISFFLNLAQAHSSLCQGLFENDKSARFGRSLHGSIHAKKIKLLVWNIHKNLDKQLIHDFRKISENSDIVLFQESTNHDDFHQNIFDSNSNLGWLQAISFVQRNGAHTGVATGSKYQPIKEEVLVSPVTEPIVKTPKTAVVTEYQIEGTSQTLMVVNIHAINFVLNSDFRKHLYQIAKAVLHHKGPLIIAGDFNTWNSGRMNFLEKLFSQFFLKKVKTPQKGFLSLDHIYYRDLNPIFIDDLTSIRSSDHAPLAVEFEITFP